MSKQIIVTVRPEFEAEDGSTFDAVFAALEHFHIPATLVEVDQIGGSQHTGLPYDINIRVEETGGAVITSNLLHEFSGDANLAAKASADAIESLLLALASAGVDVHTREFSVAITTAVEAIASHID